MNHTNRLLDNARVIITGRKNTTRKILSKNQQIYRKAKELGNRPKRCSAISNALRIYRLGGYSETQAMTIAGISEAEFFDHYLPILQS